MKKVVNTIVFIIITDDDGHETLCSRKTLTQRKEYFILYFKQSKINNILCTHSK